MNANFTVGNQTQHISTLALTDISENVQISVSGRILNILLISGNARVPDGQGELKLFIPDAIALMTLSFIQFR